MATKPSKSDHRELLQSEVASFASSLGFASSGFAPSYGFDDSDFRKSGPLKPHRSPQPHQKPATDPNSNPSTAAKARRRTPKPKRSPLDQIDLFEAIGKRKGGGFPLMKAGSLSRQWYDDAEELERKVLGKDGGKVVEGKGLEELREVVERKKEVAEKLMRQYAEDYQAGMKKSKDMHMVETAVKSGTTADKVSALTCLIEDNPVANLKSLDSLLHMVTVKVGKRYAFASFDALKELFMCRFLPERKLKSLLQRPLDCLPDSKDGYSLLLFWYWEECLKQRYEQFVIALADASKDMLPSLKDKAVKLMYLLLCGKAEQERRLLSALVNKLGDPVRKSASGAGYYLSCLLSAHPNMKTVVIDEVDSFIFRPNVGLRAKYHAINFLSQIFLSKEGDGPKLAKRLVDVYFALFKLLISENSQNGKANKIGTKKFDTKKARRLKEKKKHSRKETKRDSSDSFFEMDCRLLSAILTGVNRAFPYIASEEIDNLMEVQTPILFKLAHSKNFNVSVQALMLLFQISSKNQIASDRFYRALYSILLTPAALNSSKPELFLGLLAKALKTDININRIAAFVKRILQVCLLQPSQYACGCLFLLSEILKARPPLWNMMLQKESMDDDVEHFKDVIEDSTDGEGVAQLNSLDKIDDTMEGKSNDHEENDKDHNQPPIARLLPHAGYDPRHREPSYCKADLASWWELSVLASHVHPSVATMARTLLSGANIMYNGDPLNDLSLTSFLDKFMEKKPKQNQRSDGVWHGGSQIAPTRKLDMSHHLIGEQIVQLEEEDVPPEDIIFHKFYMNKTRSGAKLKRKKIEGDEDDFIVGSEESDDDEADEMMGADLLPSGEPDGEYEYDDLEDAVLEDEDDLLGSDEQEDLIDHRGDLGLDDDEDDDIDADDDIDGDVNLDGEADSDKDVAQEQTKTDGKKGRTSGLKRSSPFADLMDYEHLMDEGSKDGKKRRSKKKRRDK